MAGLQVLKEFSMNKGITLSILHDASQPKESLDRWANQAVAEGNPGDAVFLVPPHWHKKHSERMTVLEGRVEVTLNGEKRTLQAGDEVVIPPYTVHAFRGFPGERLVVRESADPPGSYKSEFFNDLLTDGHSNSFWYSMRAMYDGDGYVCLPFYFRVFDLAFTTFFGGLAKLFLPVIKPLEKKQ